MTKLTIFAIAALLALGLQAEKIALINGTVINPSDAKVLPNASVIIDGERIVTLLAGEQLPRIC